MSGEPPTPASPSNRAREQLMEQVGAIMGSSSAVPPPAPTGQQSPPPSFLMAIPSPTSRSAPTLSQPSNRMATTSSTAATAPISPPSDQRAPPRASRDQEPQRRPPQDPRDEQQQPLHRRQQDLVPSASGQASYEQAARDQSPRSRRSQRPPSDSGQRSLPPLSRAAQERQYVQRRSGQSSPPSRPSSSYQQYPHSAGPGPSVYGGQYRPRGDLVPREAPSRYGYPPRTHGPPITQTPEQTIAKKKKSKMGLVLLTLVLIAAIAIAGLFVVFVVTRLSRNGKDNKSKKDDAKRLASPNRADVAARGLPTIPPPAGAQAPTNGGSPFAPPNSPYPTGGRPPINPQTFPSRVAPNQGHPPAGPIAGSLYPTGGVPLQTPIQRPVTPQFVPPMQQPAQHGVPMQSGYGMGHPGVPIVAQGHAPQGPQHPLGQHPNQQIPGGAPLQRTMVPQGGRPGPGYPWPPVQQGRLGPATPMGPAPPMQQPQSSVSNAPPQRVPPAAQGPSATQSAPQGVQQQSSPPPQQRQPLLGPDILASQNQFAHAAGQDQAYHGAEPLRPQVSALPFTGTAQALPVADTAGTAPGVVPELQTVPPLESVQAQPMQIQSNRIQELGSQSALVYAADQALAEGNEQQQSAESASPSSAPESISAGIEVLDVPHGRIEAVATGPETIHEEHHRQQPRRIERMDAAQQQPGA